MTIRLPKLTQRRLLSATMDGYVAEAAKTGRALYEVELCHRLFVIASKGLDWTSTTQLTGDGWKEPVQEGTRIGAVRSTTNGGLSSTDSPLARNPDGSRSSLS